MEGGPDAGASELLGQGCDPDVEAACGVNGGSKCLTELMVLGNLVEFPGGYCSASCEASTECGAAGACPVGETKAELASTPMASVFAMLPSNCLETCESATDCRVSEGYDCKPMTAAMPEQLRAIVSTLLGDKPIAKRTLCVPVAAEARAGAN
jgi:hypothetical protein